MSNLGGGSLKQNGFILWFVFAVICFSGHAPSYAAERLNFEQRISQRNLQNLYTVTGRTADEIKIAAIDLNTDGAHEFITKDTTCTHNGLCGFTIFASSRSELIQIGKIEARNILLGNEYHHGVRSLLAYDSAANDYEYSLFKWNPMASAYEKR